jgi:hypothetical protein
MRRYHNQITIICPEALRYDANAAAVQALGPGHENTFSTRYSKSGKEPTTHYVACGQMTDSFIPKLAILADMHPQIKALVSGPGNFDKLSQKPNVKVQRIPYKPHKELVKEQLRPVTNSEGQ